jgi:TonB family protein
MKAFAGRINELKFSFTIIVSVFIHLIIWSTTVSPQLHDMIMSQRLLKDVNIFGGRDLIVNINQNGKRVIDEKTLLSDKDSSASGYITKKLGNKWLNNSLDFLFKQGSKGKAGQGQGGGQSAGSSISEADKDKMLLSDSSEVKVNITEKSDQYGGSMGFDGESPDVRIPDKWDITKENALFYSNDGRFSFNTVKYKHFDYIMNLKKKISSNWFPPTMANVEIWGYAPGRTRMNAILSQEVKLYFIMDRNGEVRKVQIVDSKGSEPLDKSCVDAIRLSKNFGKVPADMMKGEFIVIPFMFGYYVD